jgi:hypothetical protein
MEGKMGKLECNRIESVFDNSYIYGNKMPTKLQDILKEK